jgi:drug/metabolite transporter (DMT)-like permease
VQRSSTTTGLVVAFIAAASFGLSGAFIKPLLEAGWSPAAAVTVRALVGGIVLAPVALIALRGKWDALWRARWRVLGMASIGVVGTQVVYFASIQRIPISTAILIEYMAPLLLVAVVWLRSRKTPQLVVLIGSVVAVVGLLFVVSPGGGVALDPLGLFFALLAMVGCAVYYVIAALPTDGLPPVVLAAAGLLLGGVILAVVGAAGILPFTATFGTVDMLGSQAPWWVPLLIVGVLATALSYATGITATAMLGSRLASFVGLLEVVTAAIYAWLLLGEALTVTQAIGGALILAGIAFVRSEKEDGVLDIVPIAAPGPATVAPAATATAPAAAVAIVSAPVAAPVAAVATVSVTATAPAAAVATFTAPAAAAAVATATAAVLPYIAKVAPVDMKGALATVEAARVGGLVVENAQL